MDGAYVLQAVVGDPDVSSHLVAGGIYVRELSEAFTAAPFGRYYFNSLFVAIAVTIGQLITCSMAAYAFARMTFKGRDRALLSCSWER
jgi:ABC-type glycerol-3-phosphate transport system permease component